MKLKLLRFVSMLCLQGMVVPFMFVPEGGPGRVPCFALGFLAGMDLCRLLWILTEDPEK